MSVSLTKLERYEEAKKQLTSALQLLERYSSNPELMKIKVNLLKEIGNCCKE